jgi:hypothetical protein
MTEELIAQLNKTKTGLTLVAKLYNKTIQEGSDIVMTESATAGLYSGDMPSGIDPGVYSIRFEDDVSGVIVSFGRIAWNGLQEINELDLDYLIHIMSGDYVIAGTKLTINKSILSRNIGNDPIAEFELLENVSPPNSAGGRIRII